MTAPEHPSIAIATLHYGHNEGSVLQAYCTVRAIERHLPGHRALILDQRYTAKIGIEGEPDTARKRAIRDSVEQWLPLSEQRFVSDDEDNALDYVRRTCSALVVGSDELWRFRYLSKLGGLFRVQRRGFYTPVPNVYWPPASIGVPRISFASSIGTAAPAEMPRRDRRRLRDILLGFRMISVRDMRTLRFLELLHPCLAQRAALVPDPTWGYDILPTVDANALKARLTGLGVDFSRPRCGFIAGPTDAARTTAAEYRRRGYQIIGITTRNDFSDVPLFDHGFRPLEWARLFGFLDLCVSERMHGTIFCLQNETPVVALDINDPADGSDTKIGDLLRGFGLERFCLPKRSATAAMLINACGEATEDTWNWTEIRNRRAAHRNTIDIFLQQLPDVIQP
jgi:hypothetical protein